MPTLDKYMKPIVTTAVSLLLAAVAHAQTTQPVNFIEKVKPSLVVVQFTYEGELGKRDFTGLGTVVREDGLVVTPLAFTPRQVPDEQLKDFKFIIPGDDETEIDAVFLGRDERYELAFFKPKTDQKLTPVQFLAGDVGVGETVVSVGLLPKVAGYQPFQSIARVSAKLRGPMPQVLVEGAGLTLVGSPVFNERGEAIGYVNDQPERVVVLNGRPFQAGSRGAVLNDSANPFADVDVPPRLFTPARDFLASLASPPTLEKPIKIPFVGVTSLTGLSKDVAEFYGLKGKIAIQVGDVIPGFSADKAGLKKGYVIVSLNGQPLERGDLPDEAPMIFTRRLAQMNVGDKVTLGVITEANQEAKPIEVTLGERPPQANKAKRYYAEDLGFTTRDPVFDDTYARKLAADAKGVVVTFIRPQSSAQAAELQPNDFVQQVNQTPVTDVKQFEEAYTKFRKDKPKEAVVLEVLRGGNTQIIRIEPPRE